MAEYPDLFPPAYIAMIRAGEVGGVLEEAAQRIVRVMNREWALVSRRPQQDQPPCLLHPSPRPRPGDWAQMPAYQRAITLSLFLEALGMLLQSGVPVEMALKTIALLLPQAQREAWLRAPQETPDDRPLSPDMERLRIFPRFAIEMIALGEETGRLDVVAQRLAEVFDDQTLYEES
ncbi:MAG TPA: type II secretion system F family protein [Chthonomonadaceae bacterium]|nr:type II secretion system F family protein [Chthonomonadaceae bacterium]